MQATEIFRARLVVEYRLRRLIAPSEGHPPRESPVDVSREAAESAIFELRPILNGQSRTKSWLRLQEEPSGLDCGSGTAVVACGILAKNSLTCEKAGWYGR